jgi:hypothetical protein
MITIGSSGIGVALSDGWRQAFKIGRYGQWRFMAGILPPCQP